MLTLLWWMFDGDEAICSTSSGRPLLAMIPFIVMFLVTIVTTLRERSSGTLERLLSMPTGKLDLLLGYALAFGLVAAVQSVLAVTLTVGVLGPRRRRPVWLLVVVAVPTPSSAPRSGLFVSAFAETEFQAVQFMPAIVIPQILLCGLFVPATDLPDGARGGLRRAAAARYAVGRDDPGLARRRRRVRRRTSPRTCSSSRASRSRSSASVQPRCGGVRRNLAPASSNGSVLVHECSGACSCSPAASGSRTWSRRCRCLRGIVARFVPGESTGEAVDATSELVAAGRQVTLDFLGEDTLDEAQADATVAAYVEVLGSLADRGLAGPRRSR